MDLKEWAKAYAQQRSRGKAVALDGDTVHCGEETYLITRSLEKARVEKGAFRVVTLNTAKNVDILVDRWQEFILFEDLTIIFAQPNRKHAQYWIIRPFFHNMIADPGNLRKGLKSLSSC